MRNFGGGCGALFRSNANTLVVYVVMAHKRRKVLRKARHRKFESDFVPHKNSVRALSAARL